MTPAHRTLAWLGVLVVAAAAGLVRGQAFPDRTIIIVAPYPAGGPTDAAARFIGPSLAATLGQNVVVENVSGGGANIGAGRVARAAPDGHTLLVHNMNIASNVSLYKSLPFDTEKDLTGVGLINFSPFVLVGRKDLPANSMAELAAWMQQNGRQVKFAHVGAGSIPHLAAILLAKALGVEVTMIPYRGAAPALTDLLGGHVDIYFGTPISTGAQVRSGALKAFVVTANERDASLPDVPSAIQLGYRELDILFWQGLFVPSAAPKPVVDRLAQALQIALADPNVRKGFEDSGSTLFAADQQTPDAANAKLRAEIKRWGDVIRDNNVEPVQ
jgi:tripartite-type tricarboxylate transporter receptor subunit TctC